MKHAYLIIAHKADSILNHLLNTIKDERNDVYIHFDAKAKDIDVGQFKDVVCVEPRKEVYWGHISLVEATFQLWETAYQNGPYQYYHLISGVDMPIQTQDYIHEFCEKYAGNEFIGFAQNDYDIRRYTRRYLFPKSFKEENGFQTMCRTLFAKLQDWVGYSIPASKSVILKKGAEWCSVTHEFVEELLRWKGYWLKNYRNALTIDEAIAQTVAWNTRFRDRVFCFSDEYEGGGRLIDWSRGNPYSWTYDDLEEIKASDRLFCRKIQDEKLAAALEEIYGPQGNHK